MDADKQQKVAEFVSITGADTERAEFFLQSANWDTNAAVSTFFEGDQDEDMLEEMDAPKPPESQPRRQGNDPSTSQPEAQHEPQQPSPARPQPPQGRIATLFSGWSSGNPSAENDGEEGQAYYAGGSEHSGQQIVGPARDKKRSDHVAEEIFRAAKEHGAEVVSESDRRPNRNQRSHFVGTGYRLGESESETSHAMQGAAKPKQPMSVVLRLWKTGFTVNDEPLRPFNDPENRQFLASVQRGEIPQELVSKAEGGEVHLDMEDHREEDYVPPKQPKVKAFSGSGQTLGSEASTSAAVASSGASQVTVDSSQPVTNIQIRLVDGSRLVAKFNHTHTVGDLRRHIAASRPQYVGVAFSLHTTLPSRALTDDSVTLKDADLLNAAVLQRL